MPAGYTMLISGEPTDPDVVAAITVRPTTELSKCYVMPGHHGAGVASALMTRTLDAARERGAAGVWLGVNEENERAQGFYAKSASCRSGASASSSAIAGKRTSCSSGVLGLSRR